MHAQNDPRFSRERYGMTLEALKEEKHALNMRLLLAMQDHDEQTRQTLELEIRAVQEQIEEMNAPGRGR